MSDRAKILTPELQTAAENLAEALLCAGPIAAFHRAKAELDATPQANEMLQRLTALQNDLRRRQMNGGVTRVDVEQLRAQQRQVQANSVIMEYAHSQQAATAYLPDVNQEISQLIGLDFAALAGPASC